LYNIYTLSLSECSLDNLNKIN